MKRDMLIIRTFGKCSLSLGNTRVENNARRASKVWLLLVYLICNRGRAISQDELIQRLWGGNEMNTNPAGTLKTTLWRARSVLEDLSPTLGHEMILYNGSGYTWNPEISTQVDFEEFEAHCRAAAAETDADIRRNHFRAALALYQGDFLDQFSSEAWVSPLTAYYNNLYVHAALKQLPLLQSDTYAQEAVDLCHAALMASPYHEELYQHLMRGLMVMQEFQKAADVYEDMRELLFANLGVMPSEESQAIQADILRHLNRRFLTPDILRDELREKDPAPGPLFCDFSVFKQFYQAEARSVSRRGDAVHVGMLSVTCPHEQELSETGQERVMERLRGEIQGRLRRGDIVARCSVSQFVLLLQANYENSNKVCDRIVQAFMRAYPRSPACIHYTVLPLEPLQTSPSPSEAELPAKKFSWNK